MNDNQHSNHEDYFRIVINFLKNCGLLPDPETASDVIEAYRREKMSPHLCAAMLGAHHAAQDYFDTPVLMVRAADTVILIMTVLKAERDDGKVSMNEWRSFCSIASPLIDPGDQATQHAHQILGKLGVQPLCICTRLPSKAENKAREIIDESHHD